MKKDQKKVDKLLDLLPDNSMERLFYSLATSNMIHDQNVYLMLDYFKYIKRCNLSFEDNVLHESFKNFHVSFNALDDFITLNFFHENPQDKIFRLRDMRFKEEHPDEYEDFKKELKEILKEAESKYDSFRKLVEEYALRDSEVTVPTKTKLTFLGARGLCLNSDKTLCYSPKDNTNRYGYLEKIIRSKGKPISAKNLNKYVKGKWKDTNSPINIHNAIKDINKLAKENMGLKDDLILSKGGYRLNIESYEIITT